MRPSRCFVYIDLKTGTYCRYSEKTRTHVFEATNELVNPYWVEMLRISPELWDTPGPPEAA